jgi:hypothetical protein
MLSGEEIDQFIHLGFVRIDRAFSTSIADAGRQILWAETGLDPDDPSSWTRPVIWLGDHGEEPFQQAANAPRLVAAFDQLVGRGRWQPRLSLGSFPVRFPSRANTGDTGWHIDASFPAADSKPDDYSSWRANFRSRGRALLMLFLFSDVGEADAPTRIRIGSHKKMARMLASAGEAGLCPMTMDYEPTANCLETLATGKAGTVFLCHPFLVHAAQVNRGTRPRFMAQPPLYPAAELDPNLRESHANSPVELAIRSAL